MEVCSKRRLAANHFFSFSLYLTGKSNSVSIHHSKDLIECITNYKNILRQYRWSKDICIYKALGVIFFVLSAVCYTWASCSNGFWLNAICVLVDLFLWTYHLCHVCYLLFAVVYSSSEGRGFAHNNRNSEMWVKICHASKVVLQMTIKRRAIKYLFIIKIREMFSFRKASK